MKMSENIFQLTSKNFNEFISKGDSVIDFWAEWCGPCRLMAPHFEVAAKDFERKVKFGKLNVDEENEIASKFNILGIPTMIFFKDGKVVSRTSGFIKKEEIKNLVSKTFKV